VWATPSSFSTVTAAPGFTEIESGLNEKFLITIVEPVTVLPPEAVRCEAPLVADEQAASINDASTSTGMATCCTRGRLRFPDIEGLRSYVRSARGIRHVFGAVAPADDGI